MVQSDAFNRSAIATVICVPGNVRLPRRSTGLVKDSVANVSQIITIDRELLARRVGRVSRRQLHLILSGIDIVLGR